MCVHVRERMAMSHKCAFYAHKSGRFLLFTKLLFLVHSLKSARIVRFSEKVLNSTKTIHSLNGQWHIYYTKNVKLAPMISLAGELHFWWRIFVCFCFLFLTVLPLFGNDPLYHANDRFVAADQDIRAGELLLTEMPAVCGPYWDTKINCLNCYAPCATMCKWAKIRMKELHVFFCGIDTFSPKCHFKS